MRVFVVVAAFFFAASVHAQGLADPRSGQVIPNSQAAAVDDATALLVNPAGLAFVEGLELQSGWQSRFGPQNTVDHIGDAEAIVGGSFAVVGAGVGVEVPSASVSPRLRASVATAMALDRAAALGVALHGLMPIGPGSSDVAVDLGLQLRPTGFLAFGLVGENLGSKRVPSVRAGVSLRPFEMLTIGLDGRFTPASGDTATAVANGAFDPALSLRFQLGGVVVGAGAVVENLASSSPEPVALTAMGSLEVDLENLGVTLFGGATGLGAGTQFGVGGARSRASSAAWPSLLPSSGRWLGLALTNDGVQPREGGGIIDELFNNPPSSTWILAALDDAADDESIEGVLLRLQGLSLGWGRAAELRAALVHLREKGKKVIVHLDGGDDVDAFVASAADKVWMTPSGGLSLDGLRARMVYVGSALQRLGVKAEAVSAGRYKSAPRMFTHDEPSPEEVEVDNALLDGVYGTLTNAIAQGRGLSVDEVKAIIDLGGLSAVEAQEKHIVDELLYVDEIPEALATVAGRPGERVYLEGDWLERAQKESSWQAPTKIALIPIVGNIQAGKSSGGGLLGGEGAGSDDVVRAVNAAAEDDDVKAIVLRIDSPGGDAFASDVMWRAVMRAREKKPVIATMGDVAASGGYYVASAAHDIYAEDDTITGSIGVFGLLFSAGQLASDLGVKSYELSRGARPGPDLFRGPNDDEKARLQESVNQTYERFLDAVVTGRTERAQDGTTHARISKDELREIAEGRVWTGAQALERKLVDRKGSILDAIKLARDRAGVSVDEPIELSVMTGREGELPSLGALGGLMSSVLGVSKTEGLTSAMRLLLGDPALAAFAVDNEARPLVLAPVYFELR